MKKLLILLLLIIPFTVFNVDLNAETTWTVDIVELEPPYVEIGTEDYYWVEYRIQFDEFQEYVNISIYDDENIFEDIIELPGTDPVSFIELRYNNEVRLTISDPISTYGIYANDYMTFTLFLNELVDIGDPEGRVNNAIVRLLFYGGAYDQSWFDAYLINLQGGLPPISPVVLEGIVNYYSGIFLIKSETFKGVVTTPNFVPLAPEGLVFAYWTLADGTRWNFSNYVDENHLAVSSITLEGDNVLRLYAQFMKPGVTINDPDISAPTAVINVFGAFGLDNPAGYVLIFTFIVLSLIVIFVIFKLPAIVTGISILGFAILWWILGMFPFWIMAILVFVVISLLVFKQRSGDTL